MEGGNCSRCRREMWASRADETLVCGGCLTWAEEREEAHAVIDLLLLWGSAAGMSEATVEVVADHVLTNLSRRIAAELMPGFLVTAAAPH